MVVFSIVSCKYRVFWQSGAFFNSLLLCCNIHILCCFLQSHLLIMRVLALLHGGIFLNSEIHLQFIDILLNVIKSVHIL